MGGSVFSRLVMTMLGNEFSSQHKQEKLLAEHKQLFHCSIPENYAFKVHGSNQLCGDELTFFLVQEDHLKHSYWFQGNGCLLTMTSASILCRTMADLIPSGIDHQQAALSQFSSWLRSEQDQTSWDFPLDLTCFESIRAFPTRHRCVTFVVDAFKSLLQHSKKGT